MFLSRNFNYSSRLLSLATKIVVNQGVFTPLFNSYFFGMQAFLAGDSLVEVWERIKRTVPTSMMNSIKVWPLVTAVNFTWVPIEVRCLSVPPVAEARRKPLFQGEGGLGSGYFWRPTLTAGETYLGE